LDPPHAGMPGPATVPLMSFLTTSATCSPTTVPDCSGNAHGVSSCLQGVSLNTDGHRHRLPPLLTLQILQQAASSARLQGFVPRVSPLPPTEVGARSLLGCSAPPGSRLKLTTLACDPSSVLVVQPSQMRLAPHLLPVGYLALEVLVTLRPGGTLLPPPLVEFLP